MKSFDYHGTQLESFFFLNPESLDREVEAFFLLSKRSKDFLGQLIESQEIKKSSISKYIEDLQDLGYVFVHDRSTVFNKEFEVRPSLKGEEVFEGFQIKQSMNMSELPVRSVKSRLA